jgi:transcriptional regulator with XRE-family HTH domain
MKTYEFSIIACGLDPEAEGFADRFFEAGCDDATVSFQKGHIILDFAREDKSIDAAICSAIEAVREAGAHVERIEPDSLVSLADIAARAGLTRAAITNYAKGDRASDFPPPVARVTAKTSLYEWSSVAKWLFQRDQLSREQAIEAEAVRLANAAIQSRKTGFQETLHDRLIAYDQKLAAA